MIIKFKNWELYNPPSSKTSFWFRLNSNIVNKPIWDELSHEGFRVFIYLLCQCNESSIRGQTVLSTVNVSRRCTVSEKEVNRAIKILQQFQVIEVRAPSGRYFDSEQTLSTYETNETKRNETNTIMADCPSGQSRRAYDFDSLYNKYPKKEGKSRGMFLCKTQIKTQKDFDDLSTAIDRYNNHLKEKRTEPKYIKQFSTFMNSWKDWLEPDAGKVITPLKEEPEWIRKAREEDEKNAV